MPERKEELKKKREEVEKMRAIVSQHDKPELRDKIKTT